MSELIKENGEKVVDEINEKKIKCLVLSGGVSIITEYEERLDITTQEIEMYFINPMMANYVRMQNGQTAIGMAPLNTFSDEELVGPINPYSIIFSYGIDDGLKGTYENQIIKLKAKKAGLVEASSMPKQPRIGDKFKILKG